MIATLEEEARGAAERRRWVYPAEGDLEDTAYRRIAALEGLEGSAAEAGNERAEELRIDFADQLIVLGDKYFEDRSTRPFARDYYIQALVFKPDSPRASARAGMTLGQLADLRDRATESEFGEAELFTAEALTVLASDDEREIADGLADLQLRANNADHGSASAQMMIRPVVERLGGPKAKLLAAKEEADEEATTAAERGAAADPAAADPEPADPEPADRPDKNRPDKKDKGKGKPTGKPQAASTGEGEGANEEDVYDPVKSMELTRQAEAARRRGALTEAEQLYNQALGSWNRNAAALMGLSDIHFDRGAFDRAVKFANQAVRAEPRNGEYRLRLGDAYFKVLRYNDARRSYEKALEYGNKKAKERIERVREKTGE